MSWAPKHRADVPVDSCTMSRPRSMPLPNGCAVCAEYSFIARHRADAPVVA